MTGGRPAALRALTERLRAAGCVFAEDEARLLVESAADPAELAARAARRIAGEPLEHVLGRVDFAGLQVALGPGVFVPRRRSELLVAAALGLPAAAVPDSGPTPPAVVVDLCCGCGAVGAAVACGLLSRGDRRVEVHAVDLDPVALRWAGRNLARVASAESAVVQVHQGDLYAALPRRLRGRTALLLAVPPYVPTGQLPLMPAEARLHEPVTALDGGPDGLAVARRVVAGAATWLAPNGALLVETSWAQVDGLVALFEHAGLGTRLASSDEPEAVVVVGLTRS